MNMKSFYVASVVLLCLSQACKRGADAPNGGAAEVKKAESKGLVTLTAETFEKEVLQSEQLVMVDFWAPWCPPCLELAPVVSALANTYAGKVTVGKVDVAEEINKALMDKYVGEGIPLIVFFKGGKKVGESLGLVTEKELVEKIEKHL